MNEVGCGQQAGDHSEQNDLQSYSGISRDAALDNKVVLGLFQCD